MKSNFFSKVIYQIARRALSIALCLVLVFGCFANVFADEATDRAAMEKTQAYTWTRITSQKELEAYSWNQLWAEKTTKNGEGKNNTLKSYSGGAADNNVNHWTRALIIYKDGGNWYMISGDTMCNDGECITAKAIKVTYGIDLNKIGDKSYTTFTTDGGMDALWIKYCGYDSDNKLSTYYTRFGTKENQLSSNYLCHNRSNYGVKDHCCIYGELHKTSASSPSGSKHNCFACSVTLDEGASFKWNNDGSLYLFYNIPGAKDEFWNHDGDEVGVSSSTQSGDDARFYLFLGSPSAARTVPDNTVIEVGTNATWESAVIGKNAKVYVKQNATLTLDGNCVNYGAIEVDGGTLIVRGIIDTPFYGTDAGDYKATSSNIPGQITVKNSGTLIITEDGVLCGRYSGDGKTSDITISSGSNLTLDGTIAYAGSLYVDNGAVRTRPGSLLLIGFMAGVKASAASFTRTYIRENCKGKDTAYLSNWGKQKNDSARIKLTNGSSIYTYGATFLPNSSNLTVSGNSVYYGYLSSNYDASISSMLYKW